MMGYIAKERIFLNDAGEVCEPDDPKVAQQVAVPGGTVPDKLVERYGLEQDKRLMRLPGPEGPARERGSDYYELTGTEKPVTKAELAEKTAPAAPTAPAPKTEPVPENPAPAAPPPAEPPEPKPTKAAK